MALQKTTAAAPRKTSSVERGGSAYQVKGKRASAKQRSVIDGCLAQAQDDKASRRVMVAVVMAITQESVAGEEVGKTGNDDTGILQQGRNWVSESDSKDPGAATHAFLITGPTSWKKVHGSVKKAPGNLSQAIHEVQRNADPNAYARWQSEAEKTVDAWLESGGSEGGDTYIKRYSFTRGEKGQSRENSWDASARLVGEVGAYRWAAGNVFYCASGDELRAAKAAMTIRGDEAWLVKEPAWSWAAGRSITEITLMVLADRWDVMPGGCVVLDRRFRAYSGRWMVWNTSGESLDSPLVTVVLRRPTRLREEPASETGQHADDAGGGDLRDEAKKISDNRSTYEYGKGHGPKLSKLQSSDHMDCSSSCSLALFRADLFGDRKVAIVSGEFASSFGKAGKGDEFTVWANSTHVWIEGYEDGKFAWRFDTSQHTGKSGPMLTTVPRHDQGRFTARHVSGH